MSNAKTIVVVLLSALLALSFTSGAAAAKKKKVKGMELYRGFCKPCHLPDSENGEYTPMTLIMDQWETFFDEDYVDVHDGVIDPNHGDQPVLEVLTEEEFRVLSKWTIDHAADSEHPMTCG